MARHMRNGRDYSRPGPKVDYELRKDSNNAARSGEVYNKIEEIQSHLSSISERLSQYKIKEYTFEYTKTSQWTSYDIDESNAFLDDSSYLDDATHQIRYPINYHSDNYCRIDYKADATKIAFWSNHAGTAHVFIRYN